MHVYVCERDDQRLTSALSFLRQDLSWNLELNNLARQAGEQASQMPLILPPRCQSYRCCSHVFLLTQVPGIRVQVLMLSRYALYPPTRLLGCQKMFMAILAKHSPALAAGRCPSPQRWAPVPALPRCPAQVSSPDAAQQCVHCV